MTAPGRTASDLDVRVVEELLRTLTKGQRALQMYLPTTRYTAGDGIAGGGVHAGLERDRRLVLEIREQDIMWEEVPVFRQPGRTEGLAWQLHKDGLRRLTLLQGVEAEEILRFLHVVNRARLLPADATYDLLTLLWEQEFVLITYAFVEVLGDGIEFLQESAAREEVVDPAAAAREVNTARGAPGAPGLVDLADFDATLYSSMKRNPPDPQRTR